ncbi:PadR family transcriptional regulator [Candidatus Woesearchaeota archaeon]|nr:PadR family transcriptional regulator [Candidatus Woesearchaeota archaeon]
MIKGYLKVLFLKLLKNSEQSGYKLILNTEKYIGRKPSSGSVYPLLEQLLVGKYIKVRMTGRTKLYSITSNGENLLLRLTKEKQKLMSSQEEIMKVLGHLDNDTKKKPLFVMNKYITNPIVLRNMELLLELRRSLESVLQNDKIKPESEKKLRSIIKDAVTQLKSVR